MQLQVIEFLPPSDLQRTGCNLIPGSSDSDEFALPEWIKVELKRGVPWCLNRYNLWGADIKHENDHARITAARGILPNEPNRLEIYWRRRRSYDPLFINANYRITAPEADVTKLMQKLDELDIQYEPATHTVHIMSAPYQVMWVPMCDDLRRVVMRFLIG